MAIAIHIAKIVRTIESGASVIRVKDENATVPNTLNAPTLEAFLALEAAGNFLPIGPSLLDRVITVDVHGMNLA